MLAMVTGLLLSVVTVSGALVVFRTELDWLYAAKPQIGNRLADTDATVAALQARYPDCRIHHLLTPAFTDAGDEWTIRYEIPEDDEVWKAFTDPTTGQWLGDTRHAKGSAVLAWIAHFHHNLWIKNIGGILVGSAGLCLLGFIATGLWLWWPGLKRLSRSFRLRINKPGYFRQYDVHVWIGLIGIPLFLVLGITGAMFEFRWARALVHYGLGGSEVDLPLFMRPPPPKMPVITKTPDQPLTSTSASPEQKPILSNVSFTRAIAVAEAAVPGTQVLSVFPPRIGRPNSTWLLLLDYPGNVGSFSGVLAQLDQDYQIKIILDPRTMSPGGWINKQSWGLHTGTWGGAWTKSLYLFVGLLPPVLLVTGTLMWWHRHRQKRQAKKTTAKTIPS
jgi:uncharacterized iron-regulated membrane protein